MQQPAKSPLSGSVKNKLLSILTPGNTDEIIEFVKSLDDNDKKALAPVIKERIKYYSDYEQKNGRSNIRGTHAQFVILSIAAFVCLNEKDYKNSFIRISYLASGFIKFHEYSQEELMKQISIDDILEWYRPVWMNKFINDPRCNQGLQMFTYEELLRWYRKGYITLTPELVVATLIHLPFSYDRKTQKCIFHPEKLLADPLTLKEHIWYLFTYPSDIYTVMYWGLDEDTESWTALIRMLSAGKRIDRMRLLRETLLATTQNFNKPHTNWFVNLLNKLKPTANELLQLQDELFVSLNSAQTKPISNSLAFIKAICTDKTFRLKDFLNCYPALFSLPTKAILSAAVDVAGELIRADAKCAPVVCADLCNGFTSKDESIQKKIAKILVKYAEKASVKESLAIYADQILMSVRPLIKDLLESSATPVNEETVNDVLLPESLPAAQQLHISESNRIPAVESFEDFLFFLTQAFDNNEPWHTYYVPVYVQQFDKEITERRMPQLEPAFKQALRATTEWMPQVGLTDRTTATFFISYVKHLIRKYPRSSAYIAETLAQNKCPELINWKKSFNGRTELYPWYYMLQHTFDALVEGRSVILLSTPTHTPLWIDPVVLVERLAAIQGKGEEPQTYDLQLALQRSAPHNTEEALQKAHTRLKGELLDLMVFLFDPATTAPEQVDHPSWWMTAAIRKSPHTIPAQTGSWGYDTIPAAYLTGQFEWNIASDPDGTPRFKINPPVYAIKHPVEEALYSEFACSIYRSRALWESDLTRLISSSPYNHDAYVAQVLWGVKNFSTVDSMLRNSLIYSLDSLLQLRLPFSPADYLLLSLSLFAPDKTIKDYAAALWSESVQNDTLDNSLIGAEIARIAITGWLPLKRLTTLIETNMINISTTHNRALEELIVSFLAGLDARPLTSLRKLLEIYCELLSLNKSQADTARIPQLELWRKENNLKKIIKQLMELKI